MAVVSVHLSDSKWRIKPHICQEESPWHRWPVIPFKRSKGQRLTDCLTLWLKIRHIFRKGSPMNHFKLGVSMEYDNLYHQRVPWHPSWQLWVAVQVTTCRGVGAYCDRALTLFQPYFTGHSEFASVPSNHSSPAPVNSSSPQDSVIMPILFLAYVDTLTVQWCSLIHCVHKTVAGVSELALVISYRTVCMCVSMACRPGLWK